METKQGQRALDVVLIMVLVVISFTSGAITFSRDDKYLENQYSQLSWVSRMQGIQIRMLTAKLMAKQNGINSSQETLNIANDKIEDLKKELADAQAQLNAQRKNAANAEKK